MLTPQSAIRIPQSRGGFTLIELLVVMSILAILFALSAIGMIGALNEARAARTKAIINKIDALVSERWEGYRTRTVPLRLPPGTNALWAARVRLYALRELMRMELPDRITDVTDGPVITGMTVPSVTQSYRRLALRATGGTIANWTTTHEGAECLYLILATMKDGDKSALDYFSPEEVGDVDGDGMREILDGWGQPIEFLRWAPGYSQQTGPDGQWGVAGTDDDGNGTVDDVFEAGWAGSDDIVPLTLQTRIGSKNAANPNQPFAPDPFDPLRIDPRVCQYALAGPFFSLPATNADTNPNNDTFALKPLIFSAGPDKSYDVNIEGGLRYNATNPPNDPFYVSGSGTQAGTVGDIDGDGNARGWADNITNHYTETQ